MLYLYHGADYIKARKKARATVKSLLKKKPDASYREFTDETFDRAFFEEVVFGGRGLFSSKILVFLDGVFENSEAGEIVVERAKDMEESENVFIIAEGKIDAVIKKKLSSRAKHSEEFFAPEYKKPSNTLGFAVGDALGSRDRRGAWAAFEKAIRSGLAPEEINGTLFWQIKNILIVKIVGKNGAEKSGVIGFPLSKALRYEKNFSREELERMSARTVTLYHGARKKNAGDLRIALEQFILTT